MYAICCYQFSCGFYRQRYNRVLSLLNNYIDSETKIGICKDSVSASNETLQLVCLYSVNYNKYQY